MITVQFDKQYYDWRGIIPVYVTWQLYSDDSERLSVIDVGVCVRQSTPKPASAAVAIRLTQRRLLSAQSCNRVTHRQMTTSALTLCHQRMSSFNGATQVAAAQALAMTASLVRACYKQTAQAETSERICTQQQHAVAAPAASACYREATQRATSAGICVQPIHHHDSSVWRCVPPVIQFDSQTRFCYHDIRHDFDDGNGRSPPWLTYIITEPVDPDGPGIFELYPFLPNPNNPTIGRRLFILYQDVIVTDATDSIEYPFLSVSFSTDQSRYGWSGTGAYHAASSNTEIPTVGQEVHIHINGVVVYKMLIIRQSSSLQHGSLTIITVEMQSLTAQLDDYYHPLVSVTETDPLELAQLAERQIYDSAWTMSWQTISPVIQPGVFSYAKLSPIKIIAAAAQGASAFVLSDLSDQRFIVKPRWPVSAWELQDAMAHVEIPQNGIITASTRTGFDDYKTAVHVTGVHSSCLQAQVTMSTTADLKWIDGSVTNALCCDVDIARAAGIAALSDQYPPVSAQSLTLPFSPAANDIGFNLYYPGDIALIGTLKAVIYGVSVNITRGNDGRLTMRQTLNFSPSSNPVYRLKQIIDGSKQTLAEAIGTMADGRTLVRTASGAELAVYGVTESQFVWIKGQAIVADAPELPIHTILV
jgi:hypothetical protein